jgi:hypothetical protein
MCHSQKPGLGLIGDAVFGMLDIASGKDWGEVGVEFGKKALTVMATAKLDTAFGGMNASIETMSAGIGKTLAQTGVGFLPGTVTNTVTSMVNSVTYSADGGWGFDTDALGKSVVSGLAGSAVQAVQTATSGLINIGSEGLTGTALKNTSAMSNFFGGLAGQGGECCSRRGLHAERA